MKLGLDQFIFALSDTVDLVGVDETLHGKRVGCMAWNCAEELGFNPAQKKRLLQIGFLHDCGVSSTWEHHRLVNDLDWDDSQVHCRTGAKRMEFFKPLSSFSKPILHHHTHWEIVKEMDLDKSIQIEANLIYLLDRVDYLGHVTPGPDWISKKKIIQDKIFTLKDSYFHPELVEIFMEASEKEAFWFSLEPMMLIDFIEQRKKAQEHIFISNDQLKTVAELFAQIVDAKSKYTAEHSLGVARLSTHLAKQSGFDKNTCLKIEVAGLLHDLGKLKIPDNVLQKPGPLDEEELACMRHHSYVAYRILKKIRGFENISIWVGNHHEALDGSGYPFHRKGGELDMESRIITTADIFQALAQNRPYRNAQPLGTIVSFLQENARKGRLDNSIVEMIADNQDQCYQIAMAV